MDDVQKMFKILVNGQSAMKSELLAKIENVHKEVVKVHSELVEFKNETKENFDKINDRADKIGKTVAVFDEDSPIGEEFTDLKNKVDEIAQKLAFA